MLYSRSFGSVDEANLFFNSQVLDLGALATGTQDLVITSNVYAYGSGSGFHYTLAVPEPLEWLLMLSGLTLVMLAARRKSRLSRAVPRAVELLHAEAANFAG